MVKIIVRYEDSMLWVKKRFAEAVFHRTVENFIFFRYNEFE